MKVLGIVAEYNPLHNGHLYHMETSRAQLGADAVVLAMSGNFVQRGEPALLDKWSRARCAIENGVDVVFEIPVDACLGSASTYAVSGVRMLEAFGPVTHISFGSESGDLERLKRVAKRLRDPQIEELIQDARRVGNSYPRARMLAYRKVYEDEPETEKDLELLSSPNDILALEYLQAIRRVEPMTIHRSGAGYHDPLQGGDPDGPIFQSATGIREAVLLGQDVSAYVPADIHEILPEAETVRAMQQKLFDLVRCRILTMDPELMEQCPMGGEGLANKLLGELPRAQSLDDLISRTKSKRYTYTRISRLLMQILLGIDRRKYPPGQPQYLRLLGASERGRALLSQARREESATLPVVTNMNKINFSKESLASDQLLLDTRASDIYNVIAGCDLYKESDRVKRPIISTFSH